MMKPRERVRRALNHEETDRPPADLGSTCNTSITLIAYRKLADYLGITVNPDPPLLSRDMQVVSVAEPVLERLGIDTRGIHSGTPDRNRTVELSEKVYQDEWGIQYRAAEKNGQPLYYEAVKYPLEDAETIRDIETFSWPDPEDPGRTRGLVAQARTIREHTQFALVGHMGDTSIFQACTMIRGMEKFLIDLILSKPFASALLEKVTEIQSVKMIRYLQEIGAYLDVVGVGDDFGAQTGMLISPDLFRNMIKPHLKRYFRLIRENTAAKLHLHSCGGVREILSDLIDIGVEVLNPVQVSARGMDPETLKHEYGDRLSFWGGIDTHHLMPKGTPEEVTEEVRRIVRILGKGGGYVLNPVHNIQPDVPPENVAAMYDAIR